MRAADGFGDTLSLQEKAPSRGMRYLVNITNKFHVATRNTSSPTRMHTLWNKDAQRKEGTTHPWIYGSCVGAWLGPFSVLQYAIADGCGGQNPRNRGRSSEHDHIHACLVHMIKKSSSTTKRPCSSPPKFLVIYAADNNNSSVYTLETWLCCWRPKDSLLACLRAKLSRRRWTFYLARNRVCQNDEKLGFCGLRKSRSRGWKTSSFSPNFLVMYTAERKKWSISALEILSLCSSVEDSLLRVPTRKHIKTFVNLWFRKQTRIGQGSFGKKSLFITVLITRNGRLDQRAWLKNDVLEDFFESDVHTLRWVTTDTQRHQELKTPPAPLHLWEGRRVWYIEFGALQLACTPDLSKRPQNQSKSWQEDVALFAFTNKR